MKRFSHVDDEGRARMVDVGGKVPQRRRARAAGSIRMSQHTLALIRQDQIKKGDVLTVAQVAAIQAAKRTAQLIPLCHPLVLDGIDVQLRVTKEGVNASCEVGCVGRTGAEMEALTAVSAALLTVYDMCKAVDDAMEIGGIHLVEKTKSDVEQL